MSDNFTLSGDFRGSIVNIKSELQNVQQTVGQMQTDDPAAKQELQHLIQQLSDELQKTPPEKKEAAEAVSATAKVLVEQANAEKPNHTMLQITGEGLKQAAKNLVDVAPVVINIATQIVMAISRIAGSAG
jgi:regulator of replication initiation timing